MRARSDPQQCLVNGESDYEMKLSQENFEYKPITIKLEKRKEAEAFFNLIDKLESARVNEGGEAALKLFTKDEGELIVALSDARTIGAIRI